MRYAQMCLMALACSLASSGFAFAQTDTKRTFAFLVACAEYDPVELRRVPFTLHEMKLFRDALIASGIPQENIYFLHDKTEQTRTLVPIRANILREYKALLDRLKPEDSLIVVLSGHGVQYFGEPTGHFCPLDAKLGLGHKDSLIPMEGKDGLLTLLETTKAQRKLVLVNACRNDPAANAALAKQKVKLANDPTENAPKGTVVLFACSKGQQSWFYTETAMREERRNRSLFMYHVTEAWKGAYAASDKVTLDHLVSEVCDRVNRESQREFAKQDPLAKKKIEGTWVLAAVAKQVAKIEAKPAPASTRFKEITIDKPFVPALDENPNWRTTQGVRLVRGDKGRWLLLCVTHAKLETDTTAATIDSEILCRNNMFALMLEWTKDTTVKATTDGDAAKVRKIIQTRIEGNVRALQPVGNYKSSQGDVYYVVYGKIYEANEVVPK